MKTIAQCSTSGSGCSFEGNCLDMKPSNGCKSDCPARFCDQCSANYAKCVSCDVKAFTKRVKKSSALVPLESQEVTAACKPVIELRSSEKKPKTPTGSKKA